MAEQLSLFSYLMDGEDEEDLKRQVSMFKKNANEKRRWENAFQKWSDKHGMNSNGADSCGCCGYGSMCDWCDDNTYGRPCVRALNAMSRENGRKIDYSKRDFETIWYKGV